MIEEARLEQVGSGLAPVTAGWFLMGECTLIIEEQERHGASVERDTGSDAEANAAFRDRWRVERPESWSELPWG